MNYPVLQPNGLYAIWNETVDNFDTFNLTAQEVAMYMSSGLIYSQSQMEESVERTKQMLRHINECGVPSEFSNNWSALCDFLVDNSQPDNPASVTLKQIQELGLPLLIEKKLSDIDVSMYWVSYWRQRALEAEAKVKEKSYQLKLLEVNREFGD